MKDLQENIVPAANQNKSSVYIYGGTGRRVLFVGNSITKHSPKPEIGWTNDCGMAASSLENDYVHLVMARLSEITKNISFGIAQVAAYERGFFDMRPEDAYAAARDFDADVIVMFFGANVSKTYDSDPAPKKTFERAYEDMRNYLNKSGRAFILHSEGFYIRPVLDEEKRRVARRGTATPSRKWATYARARTRTAASTTRATSGCV